MVRNAQGTRVMTTDGVAQTFYEFYQDLYWHTQDDQQTQLGEDLLTSISLPRLTDDHIEKINAPITTEEIANIIQNLPKTSHRSRWPIGRFLYTITGWHPPNFEDGI